MTTYKPIQPSSLQDFNKIALLGSGSFGDVYLVKHISTDKVYAMKSLSKEKIKNKITMAQTEYKILLNLNHPFISKLYYCFQTELKIYVVMQYCPGGNFYDVLQRQEKKCLIESDVKFYASCILLALEYLHFNGVVYRDLKPENILMDATGHVLLTDFNLSICCPCDKIMYKCIKKKYSHQNGLYSEPNIKSNQQCGTAVYMAPEIVSGKIYGPIIDWWSFGILIYEMLYGIPPFQGRNIYDTFGLISKCKLEIPKHTPHHIKISHKLKNLIKKLLQYEPINRLGNGGSTEIKDHPYFKHVDFQLLKHQKAPIIPVLCSNIDHHYFKNINYENDTTIDTSKIIDPNKLKDGDVWKVFENVSSY